MSSSNAASELRKVSDIQIISNFWIKMREEEENFLKLWTETVFAFQWENENLTFFQAFPCKFISELIKPRICLMYLNFGSLLKKKADQKYATK